MKNEVKEIVENGVHIFGELLSKEKVHEVYKKFIDARKFGSNLFLSEDEYTKQNSHLKTNPTPSFNFLNQFPNDLCFIEENSTIKDTITELLGDDYEIVDKKLVCGVPDSWVPEWVKPKIDGINIACMGPFIKKEYRDITYFRGIDFHQDIIDWPRGSTDLDPSTFLTLYVYLHDVDVYDSPLHVIPKSHKLGATLFPHKLKKSSGNSWIYEDEDGNKMEGEDVVLTGKAGYVGLWHNCTLHGTQPVNHESEKFRLSLRYLIGKSNSNKRTTIINEVNSSIGGNLQPTKTRKDIDSLGKPTIKGNIINEELE
jgi:hypothetical protein